MTQSEQMMMAAVPGKAFIRVGGGEAGDFLQSILTANIDLLAPGFCMPGALLTPQGRILFDMMIYRREDGFVLESDAPRIDDLFARMRRYRLRRPIQLEIIADMALWVFWNGDHAPVGAFADPRNALIDAGGINAGGGNNNLGYRYIADQNSPPEAITNAQGDANLSANLSGWHARRIAAGIPEGPVDLTPERALMLEAGLDTLGAVDFSKGCYIGQEVTARTHYRGLVKRRLVPLVIDGPPPPLGSEVMYQDRAIATSKTSAANPSDTSQDSAPSVALALVKLTDIHAVLADPAELRVNGFDAQIAIPHWMQPLQSPS